MSRCAHSNQDPPPRLSDPPQWTMFASKKQGFTPTLHLVQNPVNGRQTPQSAWSKPLFFVANQPALCGFGASFVQNGGFGLRTPYFAQTLSIVGGWSVVANRIARIESRDLKKPKHLKKIVKTSQRIEQNLGL